MATAWQRTYESLDDLATDVVVEDREAERRAEVLERLGFDNHEGPLVRTRAKPEQLRVALGAAKLILDSGVIPSGPILVCLSGFDGPENQTDSITVTVKQR
jgi:hypothetical protein